MEVIRSAVLAGVAHGFLGARGGVFTGVVPGLHVGASVAGAAGDDPAAIAENRARAVRAVMPHAAGHARLVTVCQVHSPDCVLAGEWADDQRPLADALVTDRPGLTLGILTADCAPVLLADGQANGGRGVVGAAHAGWKGAVAGVTENTVAAMVALGARVERISAAIGPCIAQGSYEVDEGFLARFLAESSGNERFFIRGRPGHWQFDLSGYVADRLLLAGVGRVDVLGLDTYAAPDRFFSFRRATHRGEPAHGRQIALIGL